MARIDKGRFFDVLENASDVPAVHLQRYPGNVLCMQRREECDRVRKLFGFSHAAHRDSLHQFSEDFRFFTLLT
jgi:hypothetical protein